MTTQSIAQKEISKRSPLMRHRLNFPGAPTKIRYRESNEKSVILVKIRFQDKMGQEDYRLYNKPF